MNEASGLLSANDRVGTMKGGPGDPAGVHPVHMESEQTGKSLRQNVLALISKQFMVCDLFCK